MSNNREVEIPRLANAVMLWLSYASAVGREYVLCEGSIRYPVSEYLERSNVNDIDLEYGHPRLLKRQIDLCFSSESISRTALEFKYIKNGSTRNQVEKQRVFNDLMRLNLFLEEDHKAYFLICGNQVDFISDFQRIVPKTNDDIQERYSNSQMPSPSSLGFYTEWFSFDATSPDKSIDLGTTQEEYKTIYNEFRQTYSEPYLKKSGATLVLPSKLTTRLVYLPAQVDHSALHYRTAAIGIWEIILPGEG